MSIFWTAITFWVLGSLPASIVIGKCLKEARCKSPVFSFPPTIISDPVANCCHGWIFETLDSLKKWLSH